MYDHLVRLPRHTPVHSSAAHGVLHKLLPGKHPLWARLSTAELLVRSDTAVHAGDADIDGVDTAETRLYWPVGATVRWAVIANPVKQNNRTRKRILLTSHDEVRDYVQRKLAPGLDAHLGGVQDMPPDISHNGATVARRHLTGTGTVTDAVAVVELLTAGIGRGKAAGCGLLRLREDT